MVSCKVQVPVNLGLVGQSSGVVGHSREPDNKNPLDQSPMSNQQL